MKPDALNMINKNESHTAADIAVIGMAGRFPGAKNVDQYWDNLKNNINSTTFFKDDELLRAGVAAGLLKKNNYVKAKGVLENASLFDAKFFSFTDYEAEILDPQFRFLLEVAWEALENAAYAPGVASEEIGVFAGSSTLNNYYENNLYAHYQDGGLSQSLSLLTHNAKDFLAALIGYKLNLRGPCVSVQTACSTSLVAIGMACDSLLSNQCTMALAGGVSITVPLKSGYLYQEGVVLSPDGYCRPFGADANGTFPGNGVGVLVLKRLDKAIEDRDYIHAVIKGYATNNDGQNKIGFTAPSLEGQQKVVSQAMKVAGVTPDMISYIEAHGTATQLGDEIEVVALKKAFEGLSEGAKKNSITLSSVKPNIGHLDVASGIAGIIKAIQAIKHKTLPATLNFNESNAELKLEASPFKVQKTHLPWNSQEQLRTAGVSSFGMGGTNAHVILQEMTSSSPRKKGSDLVVFVLSAKNRSALIRLRRNLAKYLEKYPEADLADIAYTLQVGRKEMNCRFACIARSSEQAIERLNRLNQQEVLVLENIVLQQSEHEQYNRLCLIASEWLAGHSVDWMGIHDEPLYRVPLPTYPFEQREYWVEPKPRDILLNGSLISQKNTENKAVEEVIRDIFCGFVGKDKVSSVDAFLDVGGDSLLSLQVIAEIEKQFKMQLPCDILDKYPSARKLAYFLNDPMVEKSKHGQY